MPTAWMVRGAGGGTNVIQDFEQASCVAVGGGVGCGKWMDGQWIGMETVGIAK